MSYSAKVFRVMIASPGDVEGERDVAREVINQWKAVHSERRNIVLLPVGWETHSSPEMGSHPQTILNKQVLEKCDALVAIFWTRLGTETEEFPSGTVEEVERHIKAGKLAMLYFSSAPIPQDSINQEQYQRLRRFKTSCQARSLYEGFHDASDFREKFSHQLQIHINQHPTFNQEEADVVRLTNKSDSMLSADAQSLLRNVCEDRNGMALLTRTMSGVKLSTNGQQLISTQTAREIAKWESALRQLAQEGLVEDRSGEGEVFHVTAAGFEMADGEGRDERAEVYAHYLAAIRNLPTQIANGIKENVDSLPVAMQGAIEDLHLRESQMMLLASSRVKQWMQKNGEPYLDKIIKAADAASETEFDDADEFLDALQRAIVLVGGEACAQYADKLASVMRSDLV